MNCAQLSTQLGFRCEPVSDEIFYLESPLTLAFDGQLIGAYVQDIGRGEYRISDNADTIYCAMTHGVKATAERGRKLSEIVADTGMELSDNGEIFKACRDDQLAYYLARFVEAASNVGFACSNMRPAPISRFDNIVRDALRPKYAAKLKTDYKVVGASGHQLVLPFALEVVGEAPMLIQTVPNKDGKIDWNMVYRAVGKLLDIKNAHHESKRRVILEPGDEDENQKAAAALSDAAEVVLYTGPDHLIQALAA